LFQTVHGNGEVGFNVLHMKICTCTICCAVMFNLAEDGSSVEKVWQQDRFDTHHGGVVEVDGYLYGSNWDGNSRGKWLCVNWETGEVMYETKWENKGSILYADGMLYCYEERRGHIALVEPTPEEFHARGIPHRPAALS